MSTSQGGSRVDSCGRAFAGSQRWIQYYVNWQPVALNQAFAAALPSLREFSPAIEWVSPLKDHGFLEYRDEEFLVRSGAAHYISKLHEFWPKGGPCWDALAKIRPDRDVGILLVEAKSYPDEFFGNGCGASARSRDQIELALSSTREWLDVEAKAEWLGRLYQSANRLAHLYLLRERLGVPTWLVNVCFTGDPHSPTTLTQWKAALPPIHAELGLRVHPPFFATVFLPAEEVSG
jgi:hypothetical protein